MLVADPISRPECRVAHGRRDDGTRPRAVVGGGLLV